MALRITSYSTALFDCGDGVSAGLGQKGRKVKTIALSHVDRDHL